MAVLVLVAFALNATKECTVECVLEGRVGNWPVPLLFSEPPVPALACVCGPSS